MGKGGLGSILGEGVLWFPRQREELERDHDFEGRDQAGQQAWGDQQSPAPSGWGPDVVLRGRGPEGFHGQAALALPA